MSAPGSQHHERYEQMKVEVNRRQVDWWLYRSNKPDIKMGLKDIIEMLKNQFLEVGPFGHHFVKENKRNFKPEFYGIPLQYNFERDDLSDFVAVAYTATCGDSSILLKSVFDYLKSGYGRQAFKELELTAICVQRATNHAGMQMVVAIDCIEKLMPLSFYEHPANGRLLLALENADPPEYSALSLHGKTRPPKMHVQDALSKATVLYNECELGNIEEPELLTALYSLF